MYQLIVDTLLVEKILHFWLRILLYFWLKHYYISGFYYDSGSKVTTFLGFTTILAPLSQTVPNPDSSSIQALKNLVSKKEGKRHTNNHYQLNDMITISKFKEYDGIILNFSSTNLKECA